MASTKAGLSHDSTLMFNDRPGFRNSASLTWSPLDSVCSRTVGIYVTPSILMDSHFYDYNSFDEHDRQLEIERWIRECYLVGGSAYVNWHPHTLSKDFGWEAGFVELVKTIEHYRNLSK